MLVGLNFLSVLSVVADAAHGRFPARAQGGGHPQAAGLRARFLGVADLGQCRAGRQTRRTPARSGCGVAPRPPILTPVQSLGMVVKRSVSARSSQWWPNLGVCSAVGPRVSQASHRNHRQNYIRVDIPGEAKGYRLGKQVPLRVPGLGVEGLNDGQSGVARRVVQQQ